MTPLQIAWTVLLAVAVLLFFIVEIAVTIGGAFDLRNLMRDLMQETGDPE